MKPKYDLRKREEPKGLNELAIEFIFNHPNFVLITLFIVLAALFALLFNFIYWMSATEHVYNFGGI